MKIRYRILSLVALLAPLLWLSACGQTLYSNIDNEELKVLMAKNVTLVDIRRPEEWRQTGVIEGSKTITLFDRNGRIRQDFFPKFMEFAAPDKPIALICRTGNRTRAAADILVNRLRFRAVFNVKKGITHWIREGNPVVRYQPG